MPSTSAQKELREQLCRGMLIKRSRANSGVFLENGRGRLFRQGNSMETQLEAVRWSGGEFEKKVLDLKPAVAVFDCDGTLWGMDSGVGFMEWSIGQGLVSRSTSDWIDTRYRGYRAGDVSELAICGEMVQIYASLREEELRKAAAEYVREYVRPVVFPEMERLVAELRKAGTERRRSRGRKLQRQPLDAVHI
jgi:hypothetical protein